MDPKPPGKMRRALKFAATGDLFRRPSARNPWMATLLPLLLAAALSGILVVVFWFFKPSLASYLWGALGIFLSILAVAGIVARSVLPLPKNVFGAAGILALYAWPFQWSTWWYKLELPSGEYALLFGLGLGFGVLLLLGAMYFVEHLAPVRWDLTAYSITCLLVGSGVVVVAAPSIVLLDGLRNLAQIPQVQEAVNDKGEFAAYPGDVPLEFVHLSDLHLTGSTSVRTIEGNPPGDSFIDAYVEHVKSLKAGLVLVSGDLTDGGDLAQWKAASQSLLPLIRSAKLMVAPGNHDLSVAYSHLPISPTNSERSRLLWVLQFQAFVDGESSDRPPVLTSGGMPLGRAIMGFTSPAPRLVANPPPASSGATFPGVGPASVQAPAFPEDCFPLQWHSADGRVHVYALNSTTVPHSELGTSAVGAFGSLQLERLRAIVERDMAAPETKLMIFTFHHPIARPPVVENTSTLFGYGTLALDPTDSLTFSHGLWNWRHTNSKIQWVVCYGHRHERHYGPSEGVHLVEAPNLRPDGSDRGVWAGYFAKGRIRLGWSPCPEAKK